MSVKFEHSGSLLAEVKSSSFKGLITGLCFIHNLTLSCVKNGNATILRCHRNSIIATINSLLNWRGLAAGSEVSDIVSRRDISQVIQNSVAYSITISPS